MNLELLPPDCIASILSCTSPPDACRSAMVSRAVRHAGDSDSVWEKFLPPDYQEILSSLVLPLAFASKKELYSKLCTPRLIDEGRKSFWISKARGKKCYMLSARELSITWSSNALYWPWKPLLQSRFAEISELRTICWLEIQGKIETSILSPQTRYVAYLIVKFADRAYGLDFLPAEVSVEAGQQRSKALVHLRCRDSDRTSAEQLRVCFLVPHRRRDGWFEIELGEFFNHSGRSEVMIRLSEVNGVHLKGGLVVEGIELRERGGKRSKLDQFF